MPSMPWIKLYTEILDDPKLGRLPRAVRWTFAELCLVAGECDAEGYLVNGMDPMTLDDVAWRLRIPMDVLQTDWELLVGAGLVCHDDDGTMFVTNFSKRQGRSQSEKRAAWRERKRRQREHEESAGVTPDEQPEDVTRDTTGTHAGFTALEKSREEGEGDLEGEGDSFGADAPAPADNGSGSSADYQEMRKAWAELFPKKPQPRASNKTLQAKVRTRMRSAHFRDNWHPAMKRASHSTFCRDGPWFDFSWFVRNDDHYERCLNGKYDDSQSGQTRRQPHNPDITDIRQVTEGEYAEWIET